MCECIQKASYDRLNDVLYIDFDNARRMSYADEGPRGIEIMRDMISDEITGLVIYYPKKCLADRQAKIEKLGLNLCLSDYLK